MLNCKRFGNDKKKPGNIYDFLCVLISSALLAASLLNPSFWIYIALIPLIFVLYKTESIKKVIIYGIIIGLFPLCSARDLIVYSLKYYSILNACILLFFVLFCFLTNLIIKKIKSNFLLMIAPAFVCYLLARIFSWVYIITPLGYSQPMSAPIIWFVGIKGVTFLVILINSCFAFSLFKRDRIAFLSAIFLLFIMICCLVFSNFAQATQEGTAKIALIQGDINLNSVWRYKNVDTVFSIYENLSYEALTKNPDLIVWPEGTLVVNISERADLVERLINISKENNVSIALGGVTFIDHAEEGPEQNTHLKNTILFITPTGNVERYYSVKPLPLDRRVIAGEELANFSVNNKRFGIMLCHEEMLSDISSEYTKQDSEFLISASNHFFIHGKVLFASSFIPRVRAAENYKYFGTSTQTGITQVINPFGKVIASLEPEKQGFLFFVIYPNNKKTFYNVHGDLILNILSVFFIAFLFYGIIKSKNK